jgi:probable HAF family extracellular repeat protein
MISISSGCSAPLARPQSPMSEASFASTRRSCALLFGIVALTVTVARPISAQYAAYTFGAGAGASNYSGSLNSSGSVAVSGAGSAFTFNPITGATSAPIGVLPGGLASLGYGINAAGHLVGTVDYTSGNSRAFRWTSATGIMDLGTLSGGNSARAKAINSAGLVVGDASTAGGSSRAFLWSEGDGMVATALLRMRSTTPAISWGRHRWSAGQLGHSVGPRRRA